MDNIDAPVLPIPADVLTQLEAQHGEILQLKVLAREMVAFRALTPEETDRVIDVGKRDGRFAGAKIACFGALVYPSQERFTADIFKKKPGVILSILDEILAFTGVGQVEVVKK